MGISIPQQYAINGPVIEVECSSTPTVYDLFSAAGRSGGEVLITKRGNTSFVLEVTSDGGNVFTLGDGVQKVKLVSNGTNWVEAS